MTYLKAIRRSKAAAVGAVIALGLLVSACFLSPGKFTSTLDVRKDGRFTFTYVGELYFLSPDELRKNSGTKETVAEFEASPCYKSNGKERTCKQEDLEQQKHDWEEAQQYASTSGDELDSLTPLIQSKDLSDPATAEEFARNLARQKGWRSVTHKGGGLFEVDYAISGTLNHDFSFPVIEQFPTNAAFVMLALRKDGTVRMDAPAFVTSSSDNPLKNLTAMASAEASKAGAGTTTGPIKTEGTFTVTTNAQILANNTDEGSQKVTSGEQMVWTVNDKTVSAPMGLFRITR